MYGPYSVPDHPDIRSCERTGYPSWNQPKWPVCPICGEECSSIYLDSLNDVIGCDNCVDIKLVEGDEDNPGCPYCEQEPCKLYIRDDKTEGCDNCVTERDAWEWTAEQNT